MRNKAVRLTNGAIMTENQRDYLADLAGQKGVRLHDTDNWSVSKASGEIERLKAMPDAVFDEVTEDEAKKIDNLIGNVAKEVGRWNLT